MDLDHEIVKNEKKLGVAKIALDKVVKAESVPNYEEIVPLETREFNAERVSSSRGCSALAHPFFAAQNASGGH